MEAVLALVGLLGGAAVMVGVCWLIYRAIVAAADAPARTLQKRFVALGALQGKSKAQIVAVVGPPNTTTPLPNGRASLSWSQPGYRIVLGFSGETCEGILQESRH